MAIRRLFVFGAFSSLCDLCHGGPRPISYRGRLRRANDVQATLNRKALPISSGGSVFQNERLHTGDASQADLVFLDNTDFFLGPTSQATLNRFIYNPDSGTGRVQIEADRGVFRFVTGNQDKKDYEVVAPSGTRI